MQPWEWPPHCNRPIQTFVPPRRLRCVDATPDACGGSVEADQCPVMSIRGQCEVAGRIAACEIEMGNRTGAIVDGQHAGGVAGRDGRGVDEIDFVMSAEAGDQASEAVRRIEVERAGAEESDGLAGVLTLHQLQRSAAADVELAGPLYRPVDIQRRAAGGHDAGVRKRPEEFESPGPDTDVAAIDGGYSHI